jgi:hypothetical protein
VRQDTRRRVPRSGERRRRPRQAGALACGVWSVDDGDARIPTERTGERRRGPLQLVRRRSLAGVGRDDRIQAKAGPADRTAGARRRGCRGGRLGVALRGGREPFGLIVGGQQGRRSCALVELDRDRAAGGHSGLPEDSSSNHVQRPWPSASRSCCQANSSRAFPWSDSDGTSRQDPRAPDGENFVSRGGSPANCARARRQRRMVRSCRRVQQPGWHVGPFQDDEMASPQHLRGFGGGEKLPVGLPV